MSAFPRRVPRAIEIIFTSSGSRRRSVSVPDAPNFMQMLRKPSAGSAEKNSGPLKLTKPQPFPRVEGQKRKHSDGEEFKSMAEQVNKYQRGTPDRFRSKPRGRSQSPMRLRLRSQSPRGCTIPQSPALTDEEDRQDETLDFETDPEDKEAEHSTINDDQDRSDVESVHNSSQKMDAKWETEDGGFDDLLIRPEACEAEVCLCPRGRNVDDEDTVWETVICVVCGSKGIHIECGGLNFDRPRWKCDQCRDFLKDIPKRTVSVFNKVKLESDNPDLHQDENLSPRDDLESDLRKHSSSLFHEYLKKQKVLSAGSESDASPTFLKTPPAFRKVTWPYNNELREEKCMDVSTTVEPLIMEDLESENGIRITVTPFFNF